MADPQPRRGFQTPREVTDYFDQKNLRPAFSWLDVWGEEHAYAFTVAKATELELLTAFQGSIADALKKGQGFETWRAGLMPTLAKLGWDRPRTVSDPTGERPDTLVDFTAPRRLKTIFWSNMNAARSAGQWERAQRTKAAFPYVLYVRTTSSDPRPEHLGWVGTILPIDDPWWQTHWPPNGWGCKCSVRQVTARERERLLATPPAPGGVAYSDARPDDGPPQIFRNARTGEITEVPVGIDPGWGTNPGHARARTLVTRLTQQLDAAGEDQARMAIAEIAGSDMPRVVMALTETVFMPVAIAPQSLVDDLGTQTRVLTVSNATMRAKVGTHGGSRGVLPATFAKVQEVLDTGRRYDEGKARHRSFIATLADGLWQAVVKSAAAGRELILSSLHGADERKEDQTRARAERHARRK